MPNVNNKSPYVISLKEMNRNTSKYFLNKPQMSNSKEQISPISGAEPIYEPQRWNVKNNIRDNHNCYAYLLNTIVAKRSGKPQPGYFSGFSSINSTEYNCQDFYKRLKKDIPSLYLTSFDEKCKKGFYKGFIALDSKQEDQDYHFYRQDKDGFWSHKPGRQEATDIDANGKKIINPLKANRRYQYFDYSKPCFFFCFNNKLARSRSNYAAF